MFLALSCFVLLCLALSCFGSNKRLCSYFEYLRLCCYLRFVECLNMENPLGCPLVKQLLSCVCLGCCLYAQIQDTTVSSWLMRLSLNLSSNFGTIRSYVSTTKLNSIYMFFKRHCLSKTLNPTTATSTPLTLPLNSFLNSFLNFLLYQLTLIKPFL